MLKYDNLTEEEIVETKFRKDYKFLDPNLVDKLTLIFPWCTTLSETKFCIKKKIFDVPTCTRCGCPVAFSKGNWNYPLSCTKCDYLNRSDKAKKTMIEKYGVDSNFKLEECRTKIKNGWMEKYGVDNPFKADVVKNKILETKEIKYGDPSYNNQSKSQQTNIDKYGCKTPFEMADFTSKSNNSKNEKYGNANFNNRELATKTTLEKYGVEHVTQVAEIHEKQQKYRWYIINSPSGKNIKVQGFERFVIQNLWILHGENGILLNRSELPEIFYKRKNGKMSRYYPDGLILQSNTLIEVKSQWTLKRDLKKLKLVVDRVYEMGLNINIYVYIPETKMTICYSSKNEVVDLLSGVKVEQHSIE